MPRRSSPKPACPLLVCLLLAGCGGSGGGGAPAVQVCPFDPSLTAGDSACTNATPTADAGPDQTVDPGNIALLSAAASSDSDGTIDSYLWSQISGPTVALLGADTVQASFGAPRLAAQTDLVFQVRVSDNHATAATDQVTITVTPAPNDPPVADAGLDQTAVGNDVVLLDGRASTDPDAPLTQFSWQQVGGSPTVPLTGADRALASFDAPVVAMPTDFDFRLTVVDDFGVAGTDDVRITVLAPTFHDLSGTLTAPTGSIADTDTNDPRAPVTANDSRFNPQQIPTPVTVGGYVNVPGAGSPGRSSAAGDVDDYFEVSLTNGTTVSLVIAEYQTADLDLHLLDEFGVTVDSSLGVGQLEAVVAPVAGLYFIRVQAFSGASNYNLVVGQPPLAVGNLPGRLSAEFLPGQAIVKMRPAVRGGSTLTAAARVAEHGFRVRAGARDRSMLIELDSTANANVAAMLNARQKEEPRFRNERMRQKWRTLMALKSLARDPDVEIAEPNYLRQPLAVPNDTLYSFQWHYPAINLPAAWDLETGSSNVTVAVIDTGILSGHPDLQGRLLNGFDFVSDIVNAGDGNGIDADPEDPGQGGQRSVFHGTHVAGTIGAAGNNGLGVTGVAWDTRLLPLRVCGEFGCSVFDQIEAMRFAAGLSNSSGTVANPRADIINLSIGGPGFSSAAQATVTAVRAAGVVVIAAAGNEATSELLYPASYNGVVSVSAVGPDRLRAPYSSFGATVDVAAPGGNLGTDINGDGFADGVLSPHADDSQGPLDFEYLFLAGTSMAAPHVSGVAALMKSANAGMMPAVFDQLLAQGDLTDDIGAPGRDNLYGHGLIDAQRAVAAALAASGAPPPDNPVLAATPLSLNFGSVASAIDVNLDNAGTGALQVTGVSDDQAWLQVVPVDVDGAGLGTYTAAVDRSGLADGVYTATISFNSTVNQVQVSVIMSVGTATGGNIGHIYTVVLDPITGATVTGTESDFTAGNFPYLMSGIPANEYLIVAGTDYDNDGFICDEGEVCGEYLTSDQPIVVTVDRDLFGFDFLVNYESTVGTLAVTGTTQAPRRVPVRRTPVNSAGKSRTVTTPTEHPPAPSRRP